ncbi:MAG: PorP/SprF family type IX secretion system membrane protein [Maribacter sp.]
MLKFNPTLLLLMVVCALHAQEVTLPLDLRQHNLTNSNSSIFNPAFSVNYENSQSIGLWSRWQWQMIDGDPTTLFFNYTGKLNRSSSIAAGFYQHNTGVFLNTGGVLNYAYRYEINDRASIAFGLNLFGFQQEFTNNRFQSDPQIILPQLGTSNDFILQLAPGIQFTYDRLSVGLASENMVAYNTTEKERNSQSGERIYLGTAAYDFPVTILRSDSTSVISPMIYVKSIPGYDAQIGVRGFLTTNKFWAQTGYNSYYGLSIGGGGRFMQRLSIGALVEFGTKSDLKGNDPTFELVTAYDFGNVITRKKISDFDEEEEEKELEEIAEVDNVKEEMSKAEAIAAKRNAKELQKEIRKKTRDSLELIKKETAITASSRKEQERRTDSIKTTEEAEALVAAQRKEQQRKTDSISESKIAAETAAKEKARLEQLAQQIEKDKPQAVERYKEVLGEDGLIPGYYLIANVFGTKKYFDAFMAALTKKGLKPKSFFRSKDKFNYVYLERYNTLDEASKARDSKFNGRYPDKMSIFRVKAKDSLALVKKEAAVATNLRKEQELRADSISKAKQREAVVKERISKLRRLDSLAAIDKEKALIEAERRKNQIKLDSIKKANEAEALVAAQRIAQQRKTDSINKAKIAAETAAKEKARLEQLAQQTEKDKPQAGEKYKEVVGEDGLIPGYYLIANVFATKKYFDAFMADLTKKGLEPKSFFRSKDKYNYVYLERYDTLDEARKARDSKFNGRYTDEMSIFRVKVE